MAFEVSSVPLSETIILGLPRRSISVVSSRATRRPEIEVFGIAARHSRVTSSTILRIRNRLRHANWLCTKSRDQRAFAFASTGIGARVPTALRRAFRSRSESPFLAIQPIDTVDAGWLSVPPEQDEQPSVAEAPARWRDRATLLAI